MIVRTKPPSWFWVVGVVLLLWGIVGVIGFALDPVLHPATLAGMSAYDRALYLARPAWQVAAYGIGTITGLLGTIMLLVRRSFARPLYVLSLVAVVVLFGTMLTTTDLIAHKGWLAAAGLPVFIALTAILEIWLAGLAIRRGWIG